MNSVRRKKVVLYYGKAFASGGGVQVASLFADYLSELVQKDPNLIFIHKVAKFQAEQEMKQVPSLNLCLYSSSWMGMLFSSGKILMAARNAEVIMFLPQCSRLFFIFPLLKALSRSLTVYLADYPPNFSGNMRLSFLPGADWIYERAVTYLIRRADLVIARGKMITEYAKSIAQGHVETTVPMVQFDKISASTVGRRSENNLSNVGKERVNLLYLGRVDSSKGIDVLLRALKILHSDGFQFHLVIAGNGSEREKLIDMRDKLGLSQLVEFTGWVDGKSQKAKLFSNADIHVVPSVMSEGVPRSIEEAIIHRVPTIASGVGGIPSEFECGEVRIIPKGDSHLLASEIKRLVDGETRRSILNAAEPRRKWLLTCETAGNQHRSLINSLVF